jgi:hypothetical protein
MATPADASLPEASMLELVACHEISVIHPELETKPNKG